MVDSWCYWLVEWSVHERNCNNCCIIWGFHSWLTVVLAKIHVYLDNTPCQLADSDQCFRGVQCTHLHGQVFQKEWRTSPLRMLHPLTDTPCSSKALVFTSDMASKMTWNNQQQSWSVCICTMLKAICKHIWWQEHNRSFGNLLHLLDFQSCGFHNSFWSVKCSRRPLWGSQLSNKSQATLAKAQFKHISVICTRSCTVKNSVCIYQIRQPSLTSA